MPLWSGPFQAFSPPDIPGLVAWYDSNSTVLSNDGRTVLSLRDKYIYRNDLISFRGASNISNAAVNLLPNSGSITASNTGSNFVFSNAVMTSTRGTLEFQNQTTGATVFVCGNITNTLTTQQNMISVFTNNYSNPSSFSNNLTVGTFSSDGFFSAQLNTYDMSNTGGIYSNIYPTNVVAWYDPNGYVACNASGIIQSWSNKYTPYSDINLVSINSNTLTLSNYSGPGATSATLSNLRVVNFGFTAGTTSANSAALRTANLNTRYIMSAFACVVNVNSNNILNNLTVTDQKDFGTSPVPPVTTLFSPWNLSGSNKPTGVGADYLAYSFRTPFGNRGTYVNAFDIMHGITCNIATNYGNYPNTTGAVYVNGSNIYDRTAETNSASATSNNAIASNFDLRNSFNILFVSFGSNINAGISLGFSRDPAGGVWSTPAGSNSSFYGQIGDFIVLGPNYTATDRTNVEGFLAQKYNLTSKLAANHPFKTGYNINNFTSATILSNQIITSIAFNNNTTVPGFYTTGYLNGFNVSKNSNVNIMTTNRSNFNMFLGDSCNYTAKDGQIHNINTTIKEVIVYNNPLSSNDVNRVHNYLQTKYGTQALYNNGSNFTY